MNAYEKRRAHRQLLRKARSVDARAEKIAECLARADRYEAAYYALYGYKCNVRYVNGWYWVHHRKYRASELDKRTERLEAFWRVCSIPQGEEVCDD